MTKKKKTDAELDRILDRLFDELMDKILVEDPDFWKKIYDEDYTAHETQDND